MAAFAHRALDSRAFPLLQGPGDRQEARRSGADKLHETMRDGCTDRLRCSGDRPETERRGEDQLNQEVRYRQRGKQLRAKRGTASKRVRRSTPCARRHLPPRFADERGSRRPDRHCRSAQGRRSTLPDRRSRRRPAGASESPTACPRGRHARRSAGGDASRWSGSLEVNTSSGMEPAAGWAEFDATPTTDGVAAPFVTTKTRVRSGSGDILPGRETRARTPARGG